MLADMLNIVSDDVTKSVSVVSCVILSTPVLLLLSKLGTGVENSEHKAFNFIHTMIMMWD